MPNQQETSRLKAALSRSEEGGDQGQGGGHEEGQPVRLPTVYEPSPSERGSRSFRPLPLLASQPLQVPAKAQAGDRAR